MLNACLANPIDRSMDYRLTSLCWIVFCLCTPDKIDGLDRSSFVV